MVSTSPYGLIQAKPPKWQPQEDRAASAFIGIVFFLCIETAFEIFRVFKKRRGLYFWSLLIGVIACLVDIIGILLKFLVEGSTSYWPVYAMMGLSGWTCYTICQLLVLYSRLHLVISSSRIQRGVLYLIIACLLFFNLPTWIVVWPAWNPDEATTKRWSAPDAIVERFTQIGFTLAEIIISGIYFNALFGLLRNKPSVRQKRVFWDLIYVNAATIALDVLATVLVYINQTGTSHPVQTFSYILKFRLEFAVLNQLMAVAARGVRRDTFAEKRYHDDTMDNEMYDWNGTPDHADISGEGHQDGEMRNTSQGETEITVPTAVFEQGLSQARSNQGARSYGRGQKAHGGPGSKARVVARSLRPGGSSTTDDDDDDEIPLHMWERNGEVVMRIPWLVDNSQLGRGSV
ncbi:MAG: hypothetical protein Q9168_004998 [Polycauliona sp. 1 TL-2023]